MNNILTEKEYQRFIIDKLVSGNGYIERKSVKFDRNFAIDREVLFKFLDDTQPDAMANIRKVYKDATEDTVVNFINAEIIKSRSSLVSVLKHGVEIAGYKIDLMYTKPATTFNKELLDKYNKNIFSVMEEVWASDTERVDIVVFLNGFAIMSFELKCNLAGQNYQDAIMQFRMNRSPKTRLFFFKAGCIVNFAMDLQEVYMTTRLAGESTFFLPFNMGSGTGIDAGKGNPIYADRYSVFYMWEDILKKDTVLDLISEFIFIERKEKIDDVTGKVVAKESVIFPRYHQLDVIRKAIADVKVNRTSQNYLIQHSAGSGKTNSIAWLAHRLSSLHDDDNKIVFDNIIICTDRVVVDRQLQDAVRGIEHKTGLIKVMDDKCSSADLAQALQSNIKIIGTTIQKFPYIVDTVKNLKNKTFAVIIDEAHSSTAGKDMAAEIIYKKSIDARAKKQLQFYLQRAEKKLKEFDIQKQIEIMAVIRHFLRFYEFLIQASCFEDVELHKKYLFLTYFISYVSISQPGGGFDLSGKIKADNFIQKKGEEHKTVKVMPSPLVRLPIADDFNLNEDQMKRLSEIIDEINSKTGKTYDNDVVIKSMLQIKDLMMKSDKLRESAKANTESDFAFSYFDGIDDALIEGLSQNQDFFSLLLSNDEMKKEVLGIFVSEIYKSLREDR